MVYMKKEEIKTIMRDYIRMKSYLVKNRLLNDYIKKTRVSRSFFDRRINMLNKVIKCKTR